MGWGGVGGMSECWAERVSLSRFMSRLQMLELVVYLAVKTH